MRQHHSKHAGKRSGKRSGNIEIADNFEPIEYTKKEIAPLRALNRNQGYGISSINSNAITFLTGPAGVGKSYITAGVACEMLLAKEINKIIITRPKICTGGEEWGALPGELQDKFFPYLEPFLDTLKERLGSSQLEYMLKHKRIEAKPLAFLRGCTFHDSFVILDEAQNVSKEQFQCYLTRIGNNSKMVIAGDIEQSDLRSKSGLTDAIKRLEHIDGISVIDFTTDDIVRSGLARKIVLAYRN
jgi:phosphate starvation-inducible PhoH-like protein